MVTSSSWNMTFESTAATTVSSVLTSAMSTEAGGLTITHKIAIASVVVIFVIGVCTCKKAKRSICKWISKGRKEKAANRSKGRKGKDAGENEEETAVLMEMGEHPAMETADKCEEKLKQLYTTTGSYVQMLPWVDDDKMHIMDIYTELELIKGEDDSINGEVKSYEDIFCIKTREGHLVKRVICEGQAGLGKSTLLDKIAYDWAKSETEALKQFKLVFVLKFSALRQDSDFVGAIFDQLLPDDAGVNCSDLETFIQDNPDKVLVLMDGFDEFTTTNIDTSKLFGTVLKLLNRKVGRDCFVIVTTRPSHRATLTSKMLIEKPFSSVKVSGFSQENIERYVDRFYAKEENKGRALWDKINSLSNLKELAKSPMLLLLMCLLWIESSKLPETMSRLYSTGIKYIFKRKGLNVVTDTILKLGKVGLDGLMSPIQRLAFQEGEFDKDILDHAIQAGIITRQRVKRGLDVHNSIQFIHKTFQEYCAAKYCQNLYENDPETFREIFVGCYTKGFEYLFRFCCGDNVRCTDEIIQLLVEKQEDIVYNRKVGVLCFFESQATTLPSEEFLNFVFAKHLLLLWYSTEEIRSFVHLVKIATKQNSDMVGRVEELTLGDFPRASSLSTWVELELLMRSMPNITTCIIHPYNMKDLGDKGAIWSLLKEIKHLQKLFLGDCSLTGNDLKAIAGALSGMPNLTELNLSMNHDLGGMGAAWSHLKEMKHLQKLFLCDCSLTGDDLKAMAMPFSGMPNLTELYLSMNHDLGAMGAAWSHLKEMKHLQKLFLCDCVLTGDDLKDMAMQLSGMPNLTELYLSKNHDLGGTGTAWSHLKKMKHLQKLALCDCLLTGQDFEDMAVPLSGMPNFTELDLSLNCDLAATDAAWSHLKKIKHLQKLALVGIPKMIDHDLKDMAVALSDMPNQIELKLSQTNRANLTLKRVLLEMLNQAPYTLKAEDLKNEDKPLSYR